MPVFQTVSPQHLIAISEENPNCWNFLRISRDPGFTASIICVEDLFSWYECLNIMGFYMVSRFWFPYCCKSNTGPENLFHVFKIMYLLLQTDWKRKKSLAGVSYPVYLSHFSINSNLKHYINSQSPWQQDKVCCTSSTSLDSLSSEGISVVFCKAGCHSFSPGKGISLMRKQGAAANYWQNTPQVNLIE